MALATTCPQCKTSFRVVPDQLKLRRGFVRCGRCRNVFAGIDHLRYVDDARLRERQAQMAGVGQAATAGVVQAAASIDPATARLGQATPSDGTEPRAGAATGSGPEEAFIDAGRPDDAVLGVGVPDDAVLDAGVPDDAVLDAGVPDDAVLDAGVPDDAIAEAGTPDDDAITGAGMPDDARVDPGVPGDARIGDFDTDHEGEPVGPPGDDVEWVVVGTPVFDALHDQPPADACRANAFPADASRADAPPAALSRTDVRPADASVAVDRDEPPPYVERFATVANDDEDDEAAIDYFSTKRSRGFADRRGLAAGFVALVLAIALAMQWIVAQRSTIAVRVPAVAPLLGAALAPFGLRIEAPSELDALTIESFELQASATPDVLEIRALLRNRADHPVRWPSMQLTLTDPANRVLVSRALHPDDYLPEADEARPAGVPARTEWPLRLALEASDLQPAGYDYRVRLFYP